jgi:hypothetical protein
MADSQKITAIRLLSTLFITKNLEQFTTLQEMWSQIEDESKSSAMQLIVQGLEDENPSIRTVTAFLLPNLMNIDVSYSIQFFTEYTNSILSSNSSIEQITNLLIIFKAINLIHASWNHFLSSQFSSIFQQIIEFTIEITASPPDINATQEGYQTRSFAIDVLNIVVSRQRISPQTFHSMIQHIHNSLLVQNTQVINSIHNLYFSCIKTLYSEHHLMMNLFTETTHVYYEGNTPDEILNINLRFWSNIINYESSHYINTSKKSTIIYNNSDYILTIAIHTMLRMDPTSNPNFDNVAILITALLAQLFKLIPSIVITSYQQFLTSLTQSESWINLYAAVLIISTIYKNNPSKIREKHLRNQVLPFINSTIDFILSQIESPFFKIKNAALSSTKDLLVNYSKQFDFNSQQKQLLHNFVQSNTPHSLTHSLTHSPPIKRKYSQY